MEDYIKQTIKLGIIVLLRLDQSGSKIKHGNIFHDGRLVYLSRLIRLVYRYYDLFRLDKFNEHNDEYYAWLVQQADIFEKESMLNPSYQVYDNHTILFPEDKRAFYIVATDKTLDVVQACYKTGIEIYPVNGGFIVECQQHEWENMNVGNNS